MQRRPQSHLSVDANNRPTFSMCPANAPIGAQPECPAGFMPMPQFLLSGVPTQAAMLQAFYQRAWQIAAAKPRPLHVTADSLPREWRN